MKIKNRNRTYPSNSSELLDGDRTMTAAPPTNCWVADGDNITTSPSDHREAGLATVSSSHSNDISKGCSLSTSENKSNNVSSMVPLPPLISELITTETIL